MTRMPISALFVVAAALMGETQVSNAQSAYSYPWCSLGGTRGSNALSCYFTSWEQCQQCPASAAFASQARITMGKRHRCCGIRSHAITGTSETVRSEYA